MSDDEDVPPLEDMSSLLQQVQSMKEEPNHGTSAATPTQLNGHHQAPSAAEQPGKTLPSPTRKSEKQAMKLVEVLPASSAKPVESPKSSAQTQNKDSTAFGGFKKGFLFGGPSKPKSKQTQSTKTETVAKSVSSSSTGASAVGDAEVPYIKPKDKDKQYEMPEVQEAMSAGQSILQNKDWVTDDLLGKVQKNTTLMKRLADPSFVEALAEFQTNPQAAMLKYQNNTEMQNFLKEFTGIMGDHFTQLGDQQPETTGTPSPVSQPAGGIHTRAPAQEAELSVHSSTDPNQPTAEEERRMAQILADPEVKDILMDPRIQNIFQLLRTDPDKAHIALKSADPVLQQSIRKLCDAGLLQIQRS